MELAAIFHYRYIRIHPFEDGNGRMARMMVNHILCRHDYLMNLNLMYSTPDMTIQKLSEEVGINVAATNKQIKQLMTKGYVQRTEKDGTWRLIITPSV